MRRRAAMALVGLVALLGSGLAHASRLCGMGDHVGASTAADTRCSAHHVATSAATSEAAGPARATPPRTPLHEREPACCASSPELAALPAGRAELVRDGDAVVPAPAIVAEASRRAADVGVSLVVVAPTPLSGPRRHLVHRVLLI